MQLAFITLYELGISSILHSTQLQFQVPKYEEVKTVELRIVECLEVFAGPHELVRNGRPVFDVCLGNKMKWRQLKKTL